MQRGGGEREQRGGGERVELVLLKGTGEGDRPTWLSAAGLRALHSVLEDRSETITEMLLLLYTICQ